MFDTTTVADCTSFLVLFLAPDLHVDFRLLSAFISESFRSIFRNRRRYTNLFIYAFTYAFIHLSSHLLMHLFMHLFCIYLFFYNYIVEIFFLILIFFESNFINPNQLINREHLNFYCILFNYFI